MSLAEAFIAAGYTFPRTAITSYIPVHQFCGQSSIELFEAALELEQQGFLMVKTMARHHMDTEGQKNGANGYEEKP